MTDLNLEALRKTAEAAPQGDWRQTDWNCLIRNSSDEWTPLARCEEPRTAKHIATFDPPTALALIARIEELEATTAHQKKVIEHYTARGENLKITLAMTMDRVDGFVYDELAADIDDVALDEWGETYESDKKGLKATIARVRDLHPREVIAVHEIGEEAWCPNCQTHYPCPTIQALGDPK